MEKRRPTYDLASFKAAMADEDTLNITIAAQRDAKTLGFSGSDIVALIQGMQRSHFHRSMTSIRDHRVWQDAYHVPAGGLLIYLKFTAEVLTGFQVLSFKEQ